MSCSKMCGVVVLFLVFFMGISCGYKPDMQKIAQSEYEISMISAGDNRPAIPYQKMKDDGWIEFMALLHHQADMDDIKSRLNWSDKELNDRVRTAIEYNYITRDKSGRYRPNLMVISRKDGAELQALAKEAAEPMSKKIISKMEEIQKRYNTLDAFKNIPFEDASLLILSNVLLDNWQIGAVEDQFLKSPRTPHHGKNYYYSFMEKAPGEETEAFGIYGNMVLRFNNIDNLLVNVYGNRRKGPDFQCLINATGNDLKEFFGMPDGESVPAFKKKLVDIVLQKAADPGMPLNEKQISGFNTIGWMHGPNLCIPVLEKDQYMALRDLAAVITPDLLETLADNRAKIRRHYNNSIYSKEITPQEYTIWWYHFFYTAVTNTLIKKGFITVPASGNTFYMIKLG